MSFRNSLALQATKLRTLFSNETPNAIASEILKASGSLKDQEEATLWLESLFAWLKKDSATPGRFTRFRFLFQIFDARPEWQKSVFEQIAILLKQKDFLLRFFLQTGYSDHHGLLQETARRTLARILPAARENDLYEVARETFHNDSDVVWLESIPSEIIDRVTGYFQANHDAELATALRSAAREACFVFLARIADLGLTTEIRQRSQFPAPSHSPFLIASRKLTELLASGQIQSEPQFFDCLNDCEKVIAAVYDDMEINGASVGLVYRLEVLSAALERVRLLSRIIFHAEGHVDPKLVHRLLVVSLAGTLDGRMIIGHIRQQTHLLSRKIAERNGASGEHYIARTSQERVSMLRSAFSGGAIVVVMTLLKMSLHAGPFHLPPLFEAVIIWVIYSGGFITMQLTHSTLATKLPSFTASRLAVLMNNVRHPSELNQFADEVRTVLKSQALAFVGNLAAVIPLAFLFNLGFEALLGRHVIDPKLATSTIAGLHPIFSFAVVFGAVTGVLLWLSSLAGGWFENWVVYRKLPTAIAQSRRLRRAFGVQLPARWAQWLEKNSSGLSANITLGFLFGFVPFLGVISGLPIDSRHVTISSASAVLSSFSIEHDATFFKTMTLTSIGLLLIGIANLSVSFALALVVAARASAVNSRRFSTLLKLLRRRLIGF